MQKDEKSVLWVVEHHVGVDWSTTQWRKFYRQTVATGAVVQIQSLPGLDLTMEKVMDFGYLQSFPNLVKEVRTGNNYSSQLCLHSTTGSPEVLYVEAPFSYYIEDEVPLNTLKATAQMYNATSKTYVWDGERFNLRTFDVNHYGIFEAPSSSDLQKLKAACKASEDFDARGQLRYAMFDIDRDGKPEYFLTDVECNKAVATFANGRYKIHYLGIGNSSVIIMPSLISVATPAGTGCFTQAYLAFSNSCMTTYVVQQSEGVWGTDDLTHEYPTGTAQQFDMLRKRVDMINNVMFSSLKWNDF
ncbi:MAG: hypothetical protein HUK08_04710 [Bacteroidaceae bacterium]|nr:hypothetical protein [Bacteroidaceae bacterium]